MKAAESPVFYSKEELLFFLVNHKRILTEDEQKWIEKMNAKGLFLKLEI